MGMNLDFFLGSSTGTVVLSQGTPFIVMAGGGSVSQLFEEAGSVKVFTDHIGKSDTPRDSVFCC